MENHSFLMRQYDKEFGKTQEQTSCIESLHIDQVLSQIEKYAEGYGIMDFYRVLPEDRKDTLYRKEVLADLEEDNLYQAMKSFSLQVKYARETLAYAKECQGIQKARWIFDGVQEYYEAMEGIKDQLSIVKFSSEAFRNFQRLIDEYMENEEYANHRRKTKELEDRMYHLQWGISLTRNDVMVFEAQDEEDYCEKIKGLLTGKRDGTPDYLVSPFENKHELSALEKEIVRLAEKKNPSVFKELREYAKTANEFVQSTVFRWEKELQFYFSFLEYRNHMVKKGHFFANPHVGESTEMFMASDVYDLALAQKYEASLKKIVSNDVFYGSGEKFLVVTGPHQGGKTTFARSVGQLVYFSMMGLHAPCSSARIPFFGDILTQFPTEEKLNSGNGKLKEELIMISDSAKQMGKGAFVVIDEIFANAMEEEALQMGQKVLEKFTKQEGMGICITTLSKLSKEQDGIVSMVGKVDHENRKTFKITRSESDENRFSQDIVNKYRLSYEDLMNRIQVERD